MVLHSSLFGWLSLTQLTLPALGFVLSSAPSAAPAVVPYLLAGLSWSCLASLLSFTVLATAKDELLGHNMFHELLQRWGPCSTVRWHKTYSSLLSDAACWVSHGYWSACALLAMHHILPCPDSHSFLLSLLHCLLIQKLFQFQKTCKYWY